MNITPKDLATQAENISPIIVAAQRTVTENSRGIDDGGAPAMASALIEAARSAQRTLADTRQFPAGRRAKVDEILADAEKRYNEWRADFETVEMVHLAELRISLFKTPTGTDALIARADAEQLLQRRDMSLHDVFRALVSAGGSLAQLAISPWLELIALGRKADAKTLRLLAETEFLRAAAKGGNSTAQKLMDAPAAYAKVRAAVDKIASECLSVNRSAFAETALSWGSEVPQKDAEIRSLRARLKQLEATSGKQG